MSALNLSQSKKRRLRRRNRINYLNSQSQLAYSQPSPVVEMRYLPRRSGSDDEILFKKQKGYRLRKLIEEASLECLQEEDDTIPVRVASSSSQNSRYGYDNSDDILFEPEFNTSLNLLEIAKTSDIPFNIWEEKKVLQHSHPQIRSIITQENFVDSKFNVPIKSPIQRRSSPLTE
jgi:hypothetical protein